MIKLAVVGEAANVDVGVVDHTAVVTDVCGMTTVAVVIFSNVFAIGNDVVVVGVVTGVEVGAVA